MKLRLLTLETKTTPDVVNLLDQNVIGTPGESLVYQQLDTRYKINKIEKPLFLNLNKSDKTIATSCFCERDVVVDSRATKAFYIRYFTFLENFRPKTKTRVKLKSKKNQIREEVNYILSGNELVTDEESAYFYAYVDPNNVRSAILCEQLGFHALGSFKSYIMGRLFPKQKIKFTKATSSKKAQITKSLSQQYQAYNAYNREGLFDQDNYYYVTDDSGEIIAGVQVYVTNWNVLELGGRNGKLLLNILNHTPIFNRLIRKQYRFLAIDHILLKSGHDKELEKLIESLLHDFKLYTALILIDRKSKLYPTIDGLDTGLIGKLKAPSTIHTIFKPLNITDAGLKSIKKRPTFISSFDTT